MTQVYGETIGQLTKYVTMDSYGEVFTLWSKNALGLSFAKEKNDNLKLI